MATVEGAGIPGEELSHGGGEGRAVRATALGRRRADQEVQVVGEQRPGEDGEPGPADDLRQAGDEVGVIPVISKEQAALDAPHHHVVQGAGGIEARAARHGRHGYQGAPGEVNTKYYKYPTGPLLRCSVSGSRLRYA